MKGFFEVDMMHFQAMIATLLSYWAEQGCIIHQGYDLEVGAGTFNPATFLRCLGPEPYKTVYVEPSRRPKDGRYGENPNRVQFYHQMQVIFKPSPANIQELYLKSLERVGLVLKDHDIRFVHDDWENPTIGASGLGWEIWIDGMEASQFTYFQCVGGLPVKPVSAEITYGLERLAMYIQKKQSMFDILWDDSITYGDIFKRSEWEWSHYNFELANTSMWQRHFEDFEAEAKQLMKKNYPIPAYDFVMKASHAFNILDARGVISVTERTRFIGRVRALAEQISQTYLHSRKEQNFPLLRSKKNIETIYFPPISEEFDPEEKKDFLLEIGSEELPATFIPIGIQNLQNAIHDLLKKERIAYEEIQGFGTPRRLAIRIKGLSAGIQGISTQKKGPSVKSAFEGDHPNQTGMGFLRSLGFPAVSLEKIRAGSIPNLEITNKEGQEYLIAHLETPRKSTRKILSNALPNMIANLEFPKKMRWADFDIEYARPIRWIVALYGEEILPFEVAHVISDRKTEGHRQISPGFFSLDRASCYVDDLRKRDVIVDIEERKNSILEQLKKIENDFNAKIVAKERVLPQVLHLTQQPHLTVASFDPSFLQAPKEILISEMVEHQKYFPLSNLQGELLPLFVVTCDNIPNEQIREGNQNALSPRLADGFFLFQEDLKKPLEQMAEKLKKVTFHNELGSLYAKAERIRNYLDILHPLLPHFNVEKAHRAALLSKADLTSLLVNEFPELQGHIGKLYALAHHEDPEIATAIDEHWMPRGEKAPLPASSLGIALSLSDKVDNLLSCFCLGLIPTSSSDPFALRRQGLGILKILISNHLHLDIVVFFTKCFEIFTQNPTLPEIQRTDMLQNREQTLYAIEEFLIGRLRTLFQEYGFGKDEIEAVLINGLKDPYALYLLLKSLQDFRTNELLFSAVHEIYTRTKKILFSQNPALISLRKISDHEEDLNKFRFPEVVEKQLEYTEEKELFENIKNVQALFHKKFASRNTLVAHDYTMALTLLANLQKPLNAFFENVKVLDTNPELRTNRLALLQCIWDLCEELLDFSKLQLTK